MIWSGPKMAGTDRSAVRSIDTPTPNRTSYETTHPHGAVRRPDADAGPEGCGADPRLPTQTGTSHGKRQQMPCDGPPSRTRPPHRRRGDVEPRLVAEPVEPEDPPPELAPGQSAGRRLQLRAGVPETGLRRAQGGPAQAHDRFAGLVARRLRPLRSAVHPHGLAQRGHLPGHRRARRRRLRHAALCTAEQLAGQRQPRQGAPPALADQAEVRQPDLLGRPHDSHRQRRAGIDGLQNPRLRRRPRRCLGSAGRHLLGSGIRVAGRQALQGGAHARKTPRRRADGPDLRQPGRPQRQARPARRRQGHPRNLRPHGDERRGNGRPHRRRSHLRQGARRR